MSNDINHPVWNVYDSLRTVSLNVKYYSKRLVLFERINTIFEITIAIATSSAIAKFTIWGSVTGAFFWSMIGGIVVVLAVVKPFLKYPDKIKKIENALTKYRVLKHSYGILRINISEYGSYTEECRTKYHALLQQEKELIGRQPENYISDILRAKCQKEVNREFPANNFFIPEE